MACRVAYLRRYPERVGKATWLSILSFGSVTNLIAFTPSAHTYIERHRDTVHEFIQRAIQNTSRSVEPAKHVVIDARLSC